MSQGITHFAVGATATAFAAALVPAVRYPRTMILAGGVWAMVPDAAKLVDRPCLRSFHRSRLADTFWLHRTLDRLDRSDSSRVAAVALAVFLVTALFERRSYSVL